jgi:hypothetical protein
MKNSTDQPDRGNRLRRAQYAAVLVLGGICAYGAVRASFFFVTDFALWTGWPTSHAYLMPLCMDALSATGFLIYGLGPIHGGTRDRFALGVGVGAIAASMLGNAASHWFTTGTLEPSWVWITFSGFVPAVSIGLIVELAVRWLKPAAVSPPIRRGIGPASGSAASGSATGNGSKSTRSGGRARTASPRAKRPRMSPDDLAVRIQADGTEDQSLDQWVAQYGGSKSTAQKARDLLTTSNGHSSN